MSQTFFTSDTHFGHVNILAYCKRPFRSVGEMNEAIVQRWNERVQPEDTVYHLGDFAMGKKDETLPYGKRLNGHKVLIVGNHDAPAKRMIADAGFEQVFDEMEMTKDVETGIWVIDALTNQPVNRTYPCKIRLRHYPVGGYDGSKLEDDYHHFDFLFCGHIHEKWANRGAEINVGVDVRDFYPRTFEELTAGIAPKDFLTQDRAKHHVRGKMV